MLRHVRNGRFKFCRIHRNCRKRLLKRPFFRLLEFRKYGIYYAHWFFHTLRIAYLPVRELQCALTSLRSWLTRLVIQEPNLIELIIFFLFKLSFHKDILIMIYICRIGGHLVAENLRNKNIRSCQLC